MLNVFNSPSLIPGGDSPPARSGWGGQPYNNQKLIPTGTCTSFYPKQATLPTTVFSSPVLVPKCGFTTNLCPGKPNKTPEALLAMVRYREGARAGIQSHLPVSKVSGRTSKQCH